MKIKLAGLGLGALLAAAGPAQAGDFSFGAGLKALEASELPMPAWGLGMRDRVEVPAPIPVPAPMPVPEGFTYYLRVDLGWSFEPDPSFSESGALYGTTLPVPYSGLTGAGVTADGVLGGTIGFGAYLTPRFRGDLTLDFRGEQEIVATATYTDAGPPVADPGLVTDRMKVSRVVGLVNAYWDLMQRGRFTPYVGAGIGLVYNDISRTHLTTEDDGGGTLTTVKQGASKKTNVGLAAALMAGASFSIDPTWAIDVNYRALYLEGGSVTTTLTTAGPSETSTASLGDVWEHQIRVGLRFNIW
jgi:opacity protein-like surface antigen